MARAEQNSRRSFLRGAAGASAVIPISVIASLPAAADPGEAALLAMEKQLYQLNKQFIEELRVLSDAEDAFEARKPPKPKTPRYRKGEDSSKITYEQARRFQRWNDTCRRLEHECGVTALLQRERETRAKLTTLIDEFLELPVTTFAGLACKARVAEGYIDPRVAELLYKDVLALAMAEV